jgi:hypothetical protein
MDGFTAFRLYFSLKLHFSSPSYDVFETRGYTKGISEATFEKRKDSKWFSFLGSKFSDKRDFVQYVVACIAYGEDRDIYDLQTANDHYERWTKNKQMTTQLIVDDLDKVTDLDRLLTGLPPPILNKVIAGKINIETAVAINQVRPFTSDVLFGKENLIFGKVALKIKKLDRFVKYNTEKINFEISSKSH